MKRSNILLLLAFALLVQFAGHVVAGVTNTGLDLAGLPRVTVSTDADTSAVVRVDSGTLTGKRALLLKFVVNGQDVYQLVRIQKASNGLYIDAVAAETTTALASRIGSLNITGVSHPAAEDDAADTALKDGMTGWNGY